jgi:hypothetical protein
MDIEPDDGYLAALRGLHETLADMVLVTGLALDAPTRAVRLRLTLGMQLRQLTLTLRDALKVIEA